LSDRSLSSSFCQFGNGAMFEHEFEGDVFEKQVLSRANKLWIGVSSLLWSWKETSGADSLTQPWGAVGVEAAGTGR